MSNPKRRAKLRHERAAASVVSLRPMSSVAWTGLSCVVTGYHPPAGVAGSIEDRLEEASAIVQGLLETATTQAEYADLMRVLELLRG